MIKGVPVVGCWIKGCDHDASHWMRSAEGQIVIVCDLHVKLFQMPVLARIELKEGAERIGVNSKFIEVTRMEKVDIGDLPQEAIVEVDGLVRVWIERDNKRSEKEQEGIK